MAGYNPEVFDIAGSYINGLNTARQQRTQSMLLQRQIAREDKDIERQDALRQLAAKLYAPKQPKGGDPSSSGGIAAAYQPAPAQEDALPSMELPATGATVGGPQSYPTAHPDHTDFTQHTEAPAEFMQDADQDTLHQIALIGTPEAYSLIEHYNKQSEAGKKVLTDRANMIGQAALYADTPEKWDASIDWMVKNGHPDMDQYRGKFTPESRMAAIATAGLLEKYDKRTQDKFMPVSGIGLFKLPNASGGTPEMVGQGGVSSPPAAAVAELKSNPGSAAQFDEIFGAGAAARALGGSGSGQGGFQ